MTCSEISKASPLYLTGDLEPAQATAFAAHMESCAECRREVSERIENTELDNLLRKTVGSEDIDSSALDERVRATMRAARQRSRRWLLAGAGTAALLAVGALAYGVRVSRVRNSVYTAAARDHRLEIVERQPRRWVTEQTALKSLAVRAGVANTPVAAFAPAGYRLARGKLCLLDGRVFLHLVYVSEKGGFSLFLRQRDDSAQPDSIHQAHFASQQVAGFHHRQLSAVLVTDQSAATALQLTQSAAAIL